MSFPAYPKYKESGVGWLGEIPAHWVLTRVKHLAQSIEQGWSPQCEEFPVEHEAEWGVLKVGCVNGGRFNPSENKKLPAGLEPQPNLGIAEGDIMVSRANTRELVGSAAVAGHDFPYLMLCDKLYRIRLIPGIGIPSYLARYLVSSGVRQQIELSATGASSSMLNIGQATIMELAIALPTSEEQAAIASFLERETAKIDDLITEAEHAISLLQERRQALISAAVTGKIDVRGLVELH